MHWAINWLGVFLFLMSEVNNESTTTIRGDHKTRKLQKVYLTTLPDTMPEGLLKLHFEDNQITEIPPRPYLCNVTGLHMARNYIENITDDIVELLSVSVNRIHLQENKIVRITTGL
jgi:Leucine-rich repeat (LRR) protein